MDLNHLVCQGFLNYLLEVSSNQFAHIIQELYAVIFRLDVWCTRCTAGDGMKMLPKERFWILPMLSTIAMEDTELHFSDGTGIVVHACILISNSPRFFATWQLSDLLHDFIDRGQDNAASCLFLHSVLPHSRPDFVRFASDPHKGVGGELIGLDKEVVVFLKSVGNLQFAPPKPPLKFSGVRQATSFGAACPQQAVKIFPLLQGSA